MIIERLSLSGNVDNYFGERKRDTRKGTNCGTARANAMKIPHYKRLLSPNSGEEGGRERERGRINRSVITAERVSAL